MYKRAILCLLPSRDFGYPHIRHLQMSGGVESDVGELTLASVMPCLLTCQLCHAFGQERQPPS